MTVSGEMTLFMTVEKWTLCQRVRIIVKIQNYFTLLFRYWNAYLVFNTMALLALTRCLMVTRPLLIDSLSLKTVSFVAISSNVALSSAYVIIMYFKVSRHGHPIWA